MANGDIWFGCMHSNNSQGGTNTGTDVLYTIHLKNGWVFTDMQKGSSNSYVSAEPGKILAFNGWKKDTRQVDLKIKWEVPEGQYFKYYIYLYIEGPEGIPFTE
jgi:hypothetical protein